MLIKLRDRAGSESGFTLIELLVVILILGILAAIAIPSFISQRTKGQDASAKELALSARTAMETCATDNDGDYTNCNASALNTIEPVLVNGTYSVSGLSGTGYTIAGTSTSGNVFTIVRSSGTISRTCTTAGSGGCHADGTW